MSKAQSNITHQLFFACPNCGAEESFFNNRCQQCVADVEIRQDGITCNGRRWSVAAYYDWVEEYLPLRMPSAAKGADHRSSSLADGGTSHRVSRQAWMQRGERVLWVKGYRRWFRRRIASVQDPRAGHLLFYPDALSFATDQETLRWSAADITGVTTDGHYFLFRARQEPFVRIEFEQESALKYELLSRKWLQEYYTERDMGHILTFQPRIRTTPPRASRQYWSIPFQVPPKTKWPEHLAKSLITALLRRFVRMFASVEVIGREHWRRDAGIVIVNHQSAFDPFIVTAFLDYHIAFVTKTSSFTRPATRRFLEWVMGLPTTRHENDHVVIRLMRNFLTRGVKVGVFPEAERCWDGRRKPFKYGLVKTLLVSRMPIYPVVLEGVFSFWPRWAAYPCPSRIRIIVKPPFSLLPGSMDVETARQLLEAAFDELE